MANECNSCPLERATGLLCPLTIELATATAELNHVIREDVGLVLVQKELAQDRFKIS